MAGLRGSFLTRVYVRLPAQRPVATAGGPLLQGMDRRWLRTAHSSYLPEASCERAWRASCHARLLGAKAVMPARCLVHSGAEPVLGAVSSLPDALPKCPWEGVWSPVPPEPRFLFCERQCPTDCRAMGHSGGAICRMGSTLCAHFHPQCCTGRCPAAAVQASLPLREVSGAWPSEPGPVLIPAPTMEVCSWTLIRPRAGRSEPSQGPRRGKFEWEVGRPVAPEPQWVCGVGELTAVLLTPESQTSGRAVLGASMWGRVGLA